MACILHLETSSDVCSVALSEDGALLFAKEHARDATPQESAFSLLVDEVLSMADSAAKRLDAVALSCGPGSYTGLRISASMAKGICYGRDLPLIALPTLEIVCVPILLRDDLPETALLCPMIDARRMEVYAAVYDRALVAVRDVAADVVDNQTYKPYFSHGPVWFFGNGADKCRSIINHPNAHFVPDVRPLARWMFPLAEKAYNAKRFADVAYFEPFYLKEFVATRPRDLLHEK